jgi:hypothetical protein
MDASPHGFADFKHPLVSIMDADSLLNAVPQPNPVLADEP